MDTFNRQFGERLKALRKEAGYKSAESLSEALGVHPNTVYCIERGEQWIGPELLLKVASVLHRSVSDLFDFEGPSPLEDQWKEKARLINLLLMASPDQLRKISVAAKVIFAGAGAGITKGE